MLRGQVLEERLSPRCFERESGPARQLTKCSRYLESNGVRLRPTRPLREDDRETI